jgi:hypothetical protein
MNETSHSPLPTLQNAFPSSLVDRKGGIMLKYCASSTDTDELPAVGHACETKRLNRVVKHLSVKIRGEKGERKAGGSVYVRCEESWS